MEHAQEIYLREVCWAQNTPIRHQMNPIRMREPLSLMEYTAEIMYIRCTLWLWCIVGRKHYTADFGQHYKMSMLQKKVLYMVN